MDCMRTAAIFLVCLWCTAAEIPDVLNMQGQEAFRRGRYKDARQLFERVLAIPGLDRETEAAALANRGQACIGLHRYRCAEDSLRGALRLLPETPALWQLLGKSLFLQRRFDDAETAINHALTIAGENRRVAAILRNDLALVLANRKQYTRAVELLVSALPDLPAGMARAQVLANLGEFEFVLGRREEGLGHLREAAKEMEGATGPHHPELAAVLEVLRAALAKTGDKAGARIASERAAAIRSAFVSQDGTAEVSWRDLQNP